MKNNKAKKQKNPRTPKFKQAKYAPYMKAINEGGKSDKGMSVREIVQHVENETGLKMVVDPKNKRTVINRAITALWKFDQGLSLATEPQVKEAVSILSTEECTDNCGCECEPPSGDAGLIKIGQELASEATRLGLSEEQYEEWINTDGEMITDKLEESREIDLRDMSRFELAKLYKDLTGNRYAGFFTILFGSKSLIAEAIAIIYLSDVEKYGIFKAIHIH